MAVWNDFEARGSAVRLLRDNLRPYGFGITTDSDGPMPYLEVGHGDQRVTVQRNRESWEVTVGHIGTGGYLADWWTTVTDQVPTMELAAMVAGIFQYRTGVAA